MSYTLRKSKTKSGIYLQVYYSYFDSKIKQPRNKYIKSYGPIEILKKEGIKNPIEYCQKLVDDLNVKENKRKDEQKDKEFQMNL